MEPEVTKGDIVNLNPHHFYMKTTSSESEDAFSGETVPFDMEKREGIAEAVVTSSRKQYGTPAQKVEVHLEKLLAEPEKKPRRSRNSTGARKDKQEGSDHKPNESMDSRSEESYEG